MDAQGCCGLAGEVGVSSLEAAEVCTVCVGTSACVGACWQPSLLFAGPRRDISTPCAF